MTYTKAKLIIWNPDSYTKADVRAAAIWILARIGARNEDIDRATMLV